MPTDIQGILTGQVKEVIDAALAQRIAYDANNFPIYVGWAKPGSDNGDAVWRIQRLTNNAIGQATTIEWADGNTDFDNIWDNRASLTYS